jgi:PAS domain S-box-containing protein
MENAPSTSAFNSIDFKISLPMVKEFARSMLKLSEEVETEFFNLYYEKKPDLLNIFDKNGIEEIKEILFKDLWNFTKSIEDGDVIEKEIERISKNPVLPDIPNINLKPLDQSLRFYLFKKTYLKFIPRYTSNIEEAMEIIMELDEIILYVEHYFSNFQIDLNRQSIQKEKDFASSLINHSNNGIVSFTKDQVVTSWNKVLERISGIKKDFVLGKKLFEVFPDYKDSDEGKAILNALKGETVVIPEKEFANGTGHYELSAIPLLNQDNEISGGFIIFKDITPQKKAAQLIEESRAKLEAANLELQKQIEEYQRSQDLLRSSEKLLKKTQQMAHIGTWLWDVKDNKITWSEELKTLFGTENGVTESSIKSYLVRVDAEDRSVFLKTIRDAVRSVQAFDYEHKIVTTGNNIRYIYGQGVPEVIDGRLIITGFSQDVTQKRKAIETLENSENRFRTVCEKSPDGIFLLDENSIIYCNQAAINMFGGKAKADILRKSFIDFAPRETVDFIREKLNLAFVEESDRFEFKVKKVDEGEVWTEIIFTPIRLEKKDILYAIVRDISRRKKFEQDVVLAQNELRKINNELETRIEARTFDLEESNKNLKRVNTDLDNFIYTASHDLKAPILNIEGLIKELVMTDSYQMHDDAQLLIDMMSTCVNKFKKTIEDLADVTKNLKPDSATPKSVDVNEIIEDIKISINNLISSTKTTIITDFSAVNNFYASRKNMRSVLYNLINNSIKYASPDRHPVIKITSQKTDKYDIISVTDNGLGLKPSDREKVFSIFKRVHLHVEGSGVGLFLVKRIIENGGGRVELESEEGVGSTFKLYFKNKI